LFRFFFVLILSTIVLEMRTPLTSTGDLLFGQTRGRILALLLSDPDQSFFVRQIARQIETSAGSVQRELAHLANAGLISRRVSGAQVFYCANRDHPVFEELRGLLAKTMGVFQLLKTALTPLSSRINFAFVYGSVARSEDKAASDIDLLVVGDVSLDEVLDELAPIEKRLTRPVNPTIYSLGDLRRKLHSGNHFLRSLEKSKKIFLIGEDDEFRKASANWLVQS
jgi:predicted nucleotidyltransferase